jgi:hypothetical protein
LYNTIYNESIIHEIIIIKDDAVGGHYISLITTKKNRKELEALSAVFEDFKDND